ncbi:MAG: hypothetical protein ACTHZ1_13170 [Sphingobacterium sp.]
MPKPDDKLSILSNNDSLLLTVRGDWVLDQDGEINTNYRGIRIAIKNYNNQNLIPDLNGKSPMKHRAFYNNRSYD